MLAHENNFGINFLTPVIRGFASQTFFRNGFRLQSGSASRQFANVENVEVLKGPAVGLMTRYSRDVGDAKVSVQLNVDNLLNERYYTGMFINEPYGPKGEGYGVYGTPRAIMGQVSIQY